MHLELVWVALHLCVFGFGEVLIRFWSLRGHKTFMMMKIGMVAGENCNQMMAAKRRHHRGQPSQEESDHGKVSTKRNPYCNHPSRGSHARGRVSSKLTGCFASDDHRMYWSRPLHVFRG